MINFVDSPPNSEESWTGKEIPLEETQAPHIIICELRIRNIHSTLKELKILIEFMTKKKQRLHCLIETFRSVRVLLQTHNPRIHRDLRLSTYGQFTPTVVHAKDEWIGTHWISVKVKIRRQHKLATYPIR